MADISMRIKSWSDLDKTATEVIFENEEEPITTDVLTQLFIRFAEACGFSEKCIADSLIGCGEELLPLYKKENNESSG